MYRAIVGIGILAASCFAVGCGSSGGNSTSASETASMPLSKPQFINQAEAICTKFGKEWEAALAVTGQNFPGGPEEAEARTREIIEQEVAPLLQEEAKELDALAEPEQDKA